MGDLTKNFSEHEFECHCCGLRGINNELVLIAQAIREDIGMPVQIVSGVRCYAHNKDVGGKSNSDHLTGDGMDVFCNTSRLRHSILRAAFRAGVCRIGIGSNFIHIGLNENNPQEVVWMY